MNILVIDKNAIIPEYQKKWELLADYDDVNLILLVPDHWRENYSDIYLEKNRSSKLNIISGKVIFPGYENRGFYYTSLVKAIRRSKPDIIHLLEEPYSLFSLQTIALKKLLAKKARVIFFTSDNLSYNYKFPYRFSFFLKRIEIFTFKNLDYALCVNEEVKNILRLKEFNKPAKILPHCFDFSLFKKTDPGKLKDELELKGTVIGFIGRIIREKGLNTLLKACSELTEEFTLLIIGRGNYKSELIKLSKELSITERIRFIDVVKYEKVPKYLGLMNIFVLPSVTTERWKEQFGRVIIEAMACEVPIIGSSSGAIPEVIGEYGLIFRENDYIDLKNKILILMKNREYRNRLIELGINYVKNFSVEKFAKKVYAIYRELLND
ncbi:MAG: glycosyltransferase family 4 protein [Candidatus Helarchaeota archaeon]|nr:glycosyltransferase family 4 protein [Candidatus Helarchaeota archaeon]